MIRHRGSPKVALFFCDKRKNNALNPVHLSIATKKDRRLGEFAR
jgi:hypothetical protein